VADAKAEGDSLNHTYRTATVTRHYVTHQWREFEDAYGNPMRARTYSRSFATAYQAANWLARRELLKQIAAAHEPEGKEGWLEALGAVFPPDPDCECCQITEWVGEGEFPGYEPAGETKAFCLTKRRAWLKALAASYLSEWSAKETKT
jgi:hypothetical protein